MVEETPQPPDEPVMSAQRTRASLLIRVKDLSDQASWDEFVLLYGPFLLRCIRRAGVAEQDALDLVHDVLRIVVEQIGKFEYDAGKSFRAWLRTIAKHRAYRFFAQQGRQPAGAGGTSHAEALQELPGGPTAEDDDWAEAEWRKRVLELALSRVRHEVKGPTWEAFELRHLQGVESAEVARRLGMTVGAVYTSVSRVLQRLRQAVEEIDAAAS
jgi:RNA polymerase sigma-70 factor (ECF subfamily)